jgi:hypothetical protein
MIQIRDTSAIIRRIHHRQGLQLSAMVANCVVIMRRPFTFDGREFQIQIYDEPRDRILLCTGRQCEKSSHLAIREALLGAYYPGFQILHVAPRDEQVRSFSKKRFIKILMTSPRLRHLLVGPAVVNNQKDKVLSNETEVTFRSAFRDPDAVRGYSADLLALDEYQDLQRDHIGVIEETQSHATRRRADGSILKLRYYAGTPKTFDNPIQECYAGSTQYEWVIICEACTHFNEKIGIPNMGADYLKCGRCEKPIHPRNGLWVSYGNKDAEWAGYHINSLLYEHCDWKDLWSKLEGPKAYTDQIFHNEVLGRSFDAGAKVLTMEEVRACCDEDLACMWRRPPGLSVVFVGLDWGGVGHSTTAVHAGAVVDGKYTVLGARRWNGRDPRQEVRDVAEFVVKFGARFVAVDLGGGIRANQELAELLPGDVRVVQMHSNATISDVVRWSPSGDMFVISKPRTLSRTLQKVKKREFRFFRWEEFRPFASDLTCIYEEYNPRTRTINYDHPGNVPADFSDSLNLGVLSSDIYYGNIVPIAEVNAGQVPLS